MQTPVSITVLVPAFRSRFLSQLLESLCLQTDKAFDVLICDDASLDPIYEVYINFKDRLNLKYHRFEYNLGGSDLAAQWNRCLNLVNTDWVIMPGDDDTLDQACIKELRAAVIRTGGQFAAYRATLRGIDVDGNELYVYHPAMIEESPDRVRALLSPSYHGMIIEYLFSLPRLQELGGFVSFPVGWFSDTATWILLAGKGGIFGVRQAIANHRMSGLNLSSQNPALDVVKLKATLLFQSWLFRHRKSLGISDNEWVSFQHQLKWRLRLDLARLRTTEFCREAGCVAKGISKVQGSFWLYELAACAKLKLEQQILLQYSRLSKSK
jgi:glycosyltransferase involved in cell wall biosynthesis